MNTRGTSTPGPYDWRNDGLCPGTPDPEAFFPVGTSSDALAQAEEAKATCRRCPVIRACATWALTNREEDGVWGGLDEHERRRLRRKYGHRFADSHCLDQVVAAALAPPQAVTLRNLYDRYTEPADDGHRLWTPAGSIAFHGRVYTPNQLAFVLSRTRPPEGTVRVVCGVTGCVQFGHVADEHDRATQQERAAA